MVLINHSSRFDMPVWRWLIAVFTLLLLIAHPIKADVRATLDRNTIYDGDTVTLVIEAAGSDQDADDPDLSGLEDDFRILGTSTSRQIQIINGRRSDKQQWRVELEPKHIGEIIIPAIPVGAASTNPLKVKIEEPPASDADDGEQPVFLRMEIDDSDINPFVQQQVRLTLRLFYRLPLVEGDFDNPQPENAVIERLGNDRQYQTTIDDQAYQVVERHYAIFPEKSGELVIPPVSFTGRIASTTAQRSPFGQFDSMMDRFFTRNLFSEPGKRIRVRSQPKTLEVRARPENYRSGYWLPSEKLVIEDSWAEGPPELRVGEPVTRTITLRAKGLESSQLPDIETTDVKHVRVYPEQVVVENHTDGDWVFGTRKQNIAYVPSHSGPVTLPEMRIDWWDTANDKPQTATIPAWQLNVLPGATAPAPPVAADTVLEETHQQVQRADTLLIDDKQETKPWYHARWPWLTAGATLLIALTVIAVRRHNHSSGADTPVAYPAATVKPPAVRGSETRRRLEQACEQNDPQAAARALLAWAESEWPDHPPRSLGSLAKRIDTGAELVVQLERVLYSADHGHWHGREFRTVFVNGLVAKNSNDKSVNADNLAPLYPDWKHRQV